MELVPERMTELRALVAARLAMVPALTLRPPTIELTRLVLMERATEDAALLTARSAVLYRAAAFFSAAFCAEASSFRRCFYAAASSR